MKLICPHGRPLVISMIGTIPIYEHSDGSECGLINVSSTIDDINLAMLQSRSALSKGERGSLYCSSEYIKEMMAAAENKSIDGIMSDLAEIDRFGLLPFFFSRVQSMKIDALRKGRIALMQAITTKYADKIV